MASVPTLGAGRIVQVAALPGVRQTRVTPDDFGAAPARALSDMFQEEALKADRTAARNAVAAVRRKLSDDMDAPDRGLSYMSGPGLFDAAGKVSEGQDEFIKGSMAGLTNERQRQIAQLEIDDMRSQFDERLTAHVGRAKSAYYLESLENAQDSHRVELVQYAATAAKQSALDVTKVEGILSRQDEEDRAFAEEHPGLLGEGQSDWLRRRRAERRTGAHRAAIETLLDRDNGRLAKDYLARFGEDMDPGVRADAERIVNKAFGAEQAFGVANRAVREFPVMYGANSQARAEALGVEYRTPGQARKEVLSAITSAIEDPEERSIAIDAAETMLADNRKAAEDEINDQYQFLSSKLQQGGDMASVVGSASWDRMPTKERKLLNEQWTDHRTGHVPTEAAYDHYFTLKDMYLKDRESFYAEDLKKYSRLSEDMRSELEALQGSSNDPAVTEGLSTVKSVMDDFIGGIYEDFNKAGTKDAKKGRALRQRMEQALQDEQQERGQKLPPGAKLRPLTSTEVYGLLAPAFSEELFDAATFSGPDTAAELDGFNLRTVADAMRQAEIDGRELTEEDLRSFTDVQARSDNPKPPPTELPSKPSGKPAPIQRSTPTPPLFEPFIRGGL